MKFCPSCKSQYNDESDFCPRDGQELIVDLTGTTLDNKYRLEELKGWGGMGVVYRAEHLNLSAKVAVKFLSDKLLSGDERGILLRRFQREGQAASRLNGHPHVVLIYDLVASGNFVYMVQEYVEGRTLGAEMKSRFAAGRLFTPAEALRVLRPIASALDAAHTAGVIHRDVKPENIMVSGLDTPQAKVKLMDFGLVKFQNPEDEDMRLTAITPNGGVIGTFYYMSPEQWGITPRDSNPEIDRRADVYSLGVVAYQMMCGRRPLEARTPQELYEKVRSAAPAPLHEVAPGVPEPVSEAVSRAMAKDRADRQGSAGAFVGELLAGISPSGFDAARQHPPSHSVSKPRPDSPRVISRNIGFWRRKANDVVGLAVEMCDRVTRLYRGDVGLALSEPSAVAINSTTNRAEAAGEAAEEFSLETGDDVEVSLPIKDGRVVDGEAAQELLRYFIKKACGGETPKARLIIATPLDLTQVERSAFQIASRHEKIVEVYLADRVRCAAIGAGIPIKQSRGSIILHVGEDATEIAVLSRGRVDYAHHVRAAGSRMDEDLTQYIKRKYNLLIGERTAEAIRIQLGSAFPLGDELSMDVWGRNLIEGIPKMITITDAEVREALADSVSVIVNAVRLVLERTPPELSAVVRECGIVVTGSGALLKELDKRLSIETGLPVSVAEDPSLAVITGACRLLSDDSLGIKERLPNREEKDFLSPARAGFADAFFSLFSSDLAIDLGTANTLIYAKGRGIVVSEPSIVAINKVTNTPEAVGREAKEMLGRTPGNIVAFYPITHGVISDYDAAWRMLQYFIRKAHNGKTWVRPRVVIPIRLGLGKVERQAFRYSAFQAKASEVYLVRSVMCAAIGAGLPITEPYGNMIANIGSDTTEIAVISLSNIIYAREIEVAGNDMTAAITQYIKRKYNLLIGERTAESVKIELGSAFPTYEPLSMDVRGRNLIEGIPKTITITDEEVLEALSDCVIDIVNAVRLALERTPPELSADIVERGIVLTGGGALLKNLDKRLSIETGLPVSIADDPLPSVVLGAGKMLSDFDLLRRVNIV